MNRSFYNGVLGVKTHQFGMDVWANNITNINTVGFKYSIPEFSTIFSQQLNNFDPVSNDIGLGSIKMASSKQMKEGAFVKTDNKFDLAIQGRGFFGIKDFKGDILYTRNGVFNKDANGNLVDSSGNFVLGKFANNIKDGIIFDNQINDISLQDVNDATIINLPTDLTLKAKPTTTIKFQGNLDAFDESEDDGSKKVQKYQTQILDKDGNKNYLEVVFTKVPTKDKSIVWNGVATLSDENGKVISTNSGVLEFDSTGAFLSSTLTDIKNANNETIKLDFGTPKTKDNIFSGFDGLVSFLGDGGKNKNIITDGYKEGKLIDYGIDDIGNIQAIFDNGKSIPIYKIMVFNFQNEEGLSQVSSNYFEQTSNSGKAFLLKDNNGNVIDEKILSSSLEMSNVSMQEAMTELIVMQKAYEANAKSITTSDALLQNAINMKK